MSRIDELIRRYAPDGVEHQALGDVAEIFRGKRFVKSDIVKSGTPCIHYGEIYTHYGISAEVTRSFLTSERAGGLRFAQPGDLIVAAAGETVEDIGNGVAWLGDRPAAIHDACYVVRSNVLDAVFLSYLVRSREFKVQIRNWVSSSKISSISTASLGRAVIPIPPMEVQREIVRILDAFTKMEAELEADLEAELEARKQQYAHYRRVLLTFDSKVEWLTLGELCTIQSGGTPKSGRSEYYGGDIPWCSIGDITAAAKYVSATQKTITDQGLANSSARILSKDTLLVSIYASLGYGAIAGVPMATNQAILGLLPRDGSRVGVEYLYYVIADSRDRLVAQRQSGSQNNLSKAIVAGFTVPVPSLKEQRRIVDQLDEFDALVNDLSSGLPAEIAARRQQYAHYRDRLLSFEEAKA